jgi:subfamily B ATP-binding cassette protein MsbA
MTLFLKRIWQQMRPYRPRLLLGVICGIFYALVSGTVIISIRLVINLVFGESESVSLADQLGKAPAFLQPLVKGLAHWVPDIQSPTSKTGLVLTIALFPLIMLLRGIFGYLNLYLITWSAARAIADLRSRLFEHLQNLSLSFFTKAKTGDLISRVTNDTHVLYGIMGNSLASLIKDPVTILVLLAVMITQQPRLTLVSMIVLPLCLGPIILYGRKVRKSARAMQSHLSDLTNLMHESFTGTRIIKAYNLEQTEYERFRDTTRKYVSHIMRVLRANEIPSQLTEFLGAVGVGLVLLYVKFYGTKTPGDFVAFVISIVLMYQPIKSLARLHNQLHQAEAASHRVFELLDITSSVADPAVPVPLKATGADIHFDNIDFAYDEATVLRGVNFTVKAGQLVALVGRTGSGKTTVANLLLRFYDPQHGAVRINGTDIRQVALKDLRRQIALVTQETILFNDSIRYNIALAKPGASDGEIEIAAKHAYAHDFINDKPERYASIAGEKGTNLSMGQRQRITIARAILKDAPILVLDEATSALDTESERAVQAALEKLMENRTTICIAHRLSTIQKADLIVVLDAGRIVEAGTHAELMQARGLYCKLFELGSGGDGFSIA